ncbi:MULTISPECIES: acyl-CoA thioesterase [Galbibacter]|uniref:Acyl-CoA thioesterase n=1 Tax=Galbibacter pacificus TaxID=2996052 RepID=A0ABT6FP52_9FLAO|nr:acyl-CoA thioesterase [Galbibacter pacificus]MDG3581517.1 acyl-CoA thioesterase [Galbibacter pacificus]MDG3584995.1 acyl-CoA thioesterase [Galbibacter pacificus]
MTPKFKPVSASRIEISELMLPSHSNFSGKIHGGFILSLLDQIAFACASKHCGSYCVTASVDTVDFLKPIEIGELVTMKASVNFVGNTSIVIGIRVEAENIQTGVVKHCNSSYFTMVAKDSEGKSVKVPGLILESENDIKRFFKSIKRMQLRKERTAYANQLDYTVNQLVHELEGYNVQIDI